MSLQWLWDFLGFGKNAPEPDEEAQHRAAVLADLRALRDSVKQSKAGLVRAQLLASVDYHDLRQAMATEAGVSVAELDKFALMRLLDEAAVRVEIDTLERRIADLRGRLPELEAQNQLGPKREILLGRAMQVAAGNNEMSEAQSRFELDVARARAQLRAYQLVFPLTWEDDPVIAGVCTEIEQELALLQTARDAPE